MQSVYPYVPFLILLFLVFLTLSAFSTTLRFGLKMIINSFLGFIGLVIFNTVSSFTGVYLGINIFNSIVVGVLGPIGIIILLILKLLLGT